MEGKKGREREREKRKMGDLQSGQRYAQCHVYYIL